MSEPLKSEREAEIRTRELLATRGPWGLYEEATGRVDIAAELAETGHGYRCRRGIAQLDTEPIDNDPTHRDWSEAEDNEQVRIDAEFIAHARGDVPALLAEIDRLRVELAEQQVQIEELQGLHTCPALATNLDRCCKTPGHSGDHSSFAGRHIWSPAHAAEAARLHHCPAEYGGPGYSHCELTVGHDGQHEAAVGNMRRATWGGDL